ncbi:MAG: lytic transglycosylase domain-containing protein [Bacteroidota bacterium]
MTKKKVFYLTSSALSLFILSTFLCFQNTGQNNDKQYLEEFRASNKAFAVEIPSELDFAGESVPLDIFYSREALDRELLVNTYWHSNTMLLLKRTARYFPVIEPILKKNGVPDDFKYLALIESGLMNTVSPSNATGFWQFLDKTGKQYGLEVTEQVDERYHIVKSTEAACRYLKAAFMEFNNWTMAAASYNAGQGRISREVTRQKTKDYYDLYLNAETSRYVFRILALKLISENPAGYGFYLRNKDLYPPLTTYRITVDTSITDLVTFAARNNVSYKVLKEFNPWLRSDQLKVLPGKSYTFDFPDKNSIHYSRMLNQVKDPDFIRGAPEMAVPGNDADNNKQE